MRLSAAALKLEKGDQAKETHAMRLYLFVNL